jgi:hypothetical protein
MANLVGVVGQSGSGKSTSARTLNPEETFIINTIGKPLPFPGAKKKYVKLHKEANGYVGNLYVGKDPNQIMNVLKIINTQMKHIKNVVIEDANYIMSCEAMDRSDEKSYDKFTQMAKHYYDILMYAASMREDIKVFVLSHIENVGDVINPQWKVKTLGKMLDSTLNVDGCFTYMLYTELRESDEGTMQRVFRTNTIDGSDTCKSPMGVFPELYMPNDLQMVVNAINKFEEGE